MAFTTRHVQTAFHGAKGGGNNGIPSSWFMNTMFASYPRAVLLERCPEKKDATPQMFGGGSYAEQEGEGLVSFSVEEAMH
jgi:hypothetical protein